MIKSQIRWLAGISAVLFATLISFTAIAQTQVNQISISVSPTVFELSANPGDSLFEQFRIVNGTDQDLVLSTTPKNFTASGEEGGVDLTEEETGFSLASWITVDPVDIVIPARGSKIFKFSIDVPISAEPGGHFGSVIVKTEGVRVDQTGASVSEEIGPLILVSIAGDVKEEASIVEFKTAKSFWETGPIEFNTRVENSGNVHFKPRGTIVIKNTFGSQETSINLEEKNVLPGTIRKLVNEWSPGFKIGRYTADLSVVYGKDSTIKTASTSFIIFPYKIVIPAIIGVILLVFVLVRFRTRIAAASKALAGK